MEQGLGMGAVRIRLIVGFWPLGTSLSSWEGARGQRPGLEEKGAGWQAVVCFPLFEEVWDLGRKGSLFNFFFFKYPGFVCKVCLILDPLFPQGPLSVQN